MTPILFIIISVLVLSLLVYWVLSSKDRRPIPIDRTFYFEAGPELSMEQIDLPPNTIVIRGDKADRLIAYWHLSKERFEEASHSQQLDPSELILRLYEAGDRLRYDDVQVDTLQGRCKLQLQPGNAYYACLGVMDQQRFIPLLTSDTIIRQV